MQCDVAAGADRDGRLSPASDQGTMVGPGSCFPAGEGPTREAGERSRTHLRGEGDR